MSLSLCLLAWCAVQHAAASDTTIPSTDPRVHRLGRTFTNAEGLGVSWLGSGARVSHTGKTLRVMFAASKSAFKVAFYQSNEGYYPFQGVAWVPGSGLNETIVIGAGSAGTINVVMNDAPQYWGSTQTILSFTSDGSFSAPAPPKRVLHALGDSITASTNIHGGVPGCADGGYQCDYSSSWMGILSALFDASASTVAVGGMGLVRNCCGQEGNMPDFYQQVAYNGPPFDFAADADNTPDAVLVYLGTNDYSAGENPALDAEFTAHFVSYMKNVTQLWYGTEQSPANITCK
jgi:hypothetical protein